MLLSPRDLLDFNDQATADDGNITEALDYIADTVYAWEEQAKPVRFNVLKLVCVFRFVHFRNLVLPGIQSEAPRDSLKALAFTHNLQLAVPGGVSTCEGGAGASASGK